MNKYEIKIDGKKWRRLFKANNSQEIVEKMAKMAAFGKPLFGEIVVKMVDADTRGEKWGIYRDVWNNYDIEIKAIDEEEAESDV